MARAKVECFTPVPHSRAHGYAVSVLSGGSPTLSILSGVLATGIAALALAIAAGDTPSASLEILGSRADSLSGAVCVAIAVAVVTALKFVSAPHSDVEKLIIIPNIGVQMETWAGEKLVQREIVPLGQINGVVIHEAIHWCRVRCFLALIMPPSQGKLKLVFPSKNVPLRDLQDMLNEITDLLKLDEED